MEKSKHVYFNNEIPYSEIASFIQPVKANICIHACDFDNLAKGNSKIIYDNIMHIYQVMLKDVNFDRLYQKKSLYSIINITYNAHSNGYDFRINPIDVVNSIYNYLGLESNIPYINLDSPHGIEYFKDYVRSYTTSIERTCESKAKIMIAKEVYASINTIIRYYQVDINELMQSVVIPKDVIFYIAYRNLRLYKQTNDKKYLIYPYEYYVNVSHMRTSAYPHKISINGSSLWFGDFRKEFESLNVVEINDAPYLVTDNEILIGFDILKPGAAEQIMREAVQRNRAISNVDYEKYQKLFEVKMNYYMNSPYSKLISGAYGLSGYMGFSYSNEYLIFDKFHNSETINTYFVRICACTHV